MIVLVILLVGFIAVIVMALIGRSNLAKREREKQAAMSPEQLQAYLQNNAQIEAIRRRDQAAARQNASDTLCYGQINAAMVCPHCNTKGQIRTKSIVSKKGVSGGKATAALLTGGVSLLATGLSRKEKATQAWCGVCKNVWAF